MLSSKIKEIKTLDKFTTIIKERYLQEKTLENVMRELKSAFQLPMEAVKSFGRRKDKLAVEVKQLVIAKYGANVIGAMVN